MLRTIIALVVSLALLIGAHDYLVRQYSKENPRHIDTVSIVNRKGITAEDIDAVGLFLPGYEFELVFRKTEGAWRLPAYRDAYAQADRIESVIRDIVESGGVPADMRGREDSFYGINESSLRIKLYVGSGESVADVICGRQLPGMWGRDSYVRVTGRAEIYHINGNPVSKIGVPGNLPPLVDPRIIPGGMGSPGEPAKVIFEPPGVMPVISMERRERQPTEDELKSMPPGMRDMKHYDWYAISDEEEIKLDERSAGSYISFLRNLEYSRIPKTEELPAGGGEPEKRLTVVFESRKSDNEEEPLETTLKIRSELIEIRGDDGKGNMLVFFSGTGFIASVDSRKTDLMFPQIDILKNPQPSPSVFDRAR